MDGSLDYPKKIPSHTPSLIQKVKPGFKVRLKFKTSASGLLIVPFNCKENGTVDTLFMR